MFTGASGRAARVCPTNRTQQSLCKHIDHYAQNADTRARAHPLLLRTARRTSRYRRMRQPPKRHRQIRHTTGIAQPPVLLGQNAAVARVKKHGATSCDRHASNNPRNCLNQPSHSQLYSFPSKRFHVLLNSLFKVLCNFPSRYLFAIGLAVIFSLR